MRTILLLALVTMLATTGIAHHPECPAEPTTLTLHSTAGSFYVVVDDCDPLGGGCIFSAWVYEERNGHPGLQTDPDGPCGSDTAASP